MAFASAAPVIARRTFAPACARAPERGATARVARGARAQRGAAVRMAGSGATFAEAPDASKMRIGVVSTRWNKDLVGPMTGQVLETLAAAGVPGDNVVKMEVPGAFELPMATRLMVASQKVDAVVCLGVLIKGETDHYEHIASAVAGGLMDVQLSTLVPVIFGVLTCRTLEHAAARSTGDKAEAPTWARTAVEMASLRASQVGGVAAGKKSVGFF